ncbi:hypothetical protein [Bradyrhizobium canariense]|uniref:hypothetical protein n=1 Tax=Bradyrhizobium canariense TaxID=255045 RepID=UPI001431241F|nr:hypothetical protein [Bradyrhizobium canariense]
MADAPIKPNRNIRSNASKRAARLLQSNASSVRRTALLIISRYLERTIKTATMKTFEDF